MNQGFEYLKNRGFKSDTLKEFDIMYYDGNTTFSFECTSQKGLCEEIRPLYKDTFKNSILFPVFDTYGKVVAVSARRFDGMPKFDSSSFNKRYVLYGLNKTYNNILMKDSVFITEGAFDFLMLWQYGIQNVVSSNGCALTFEQMCLAFRFTNNIYIVYDNDEAGRLGADKAQKLIKSHGGKCKIINLSCDADEYLIKYGAEEFLKHAQITR